MKIIVGDVHGQIDLLDNMINLLMSQMNLSDEEIKRNLVLVGDLFDRGTESPDKIFDYFLQNNLTSVLGNHESLLLSSMGIRYDIPNFGYKEKARLIWSNPKNKGEVILDYLENLKLEDNPKYTQIINYITQMDKFKQFDQEGVIVTHSFLPSIATYYLVFGGNLKSMSDLPNTFLLWSSLISPFMEPLEAMLNEPNKTKLPKYRYVMGHHVNNIIKGKNSMNFCIDTGAFHTGKLTALIVDSLKEEPFTVTIKR